MARALARPPVLVGASLGGISSLLAIHRAREPIARALVLVDIATRMEPKGLERIFEFMRARPEGFASLSEEGARVFLEQVPHAKLADISKAGHMVAGDRNDLFTGAVLELLEEELGGPNAT